MHGPTLSSNPLIIGGPVMRLQRSALRSTLSVDFTALDAGALVTLPGGLSFSRASIASVQDSANTVVTTGITSDVARVGLVGGVKVLVFEGAATNLLTTPRAPQSWTGAPSSGTTTANSTAGPDGTVSAALHAVTSGGFSRYFTTTTLYTAGSPHVASMWAKPGSSSAYQINVADAAGHCMAGALAAGWNRLTKGITPGGTSGAIIPVDGRDGSAIGGVVAGAKNHYSDMHQLEGGRAYATSWVSGTRAGERMWTPASSMVSRGRLRVRLKWTAPGASTAMPWNERLWTLDANNYAELDAAKQRVRVVVGGVPVLMSTVLAWAAGDVVELRLDAGNGIPSGWYAVNGGSQTDLGTTTTTHTRIVPEGASLDLCCNGTTAQLEGGLHALTAYGYSGSSSSPPRVYAAPGASGVGTLADPASLSGAQTIARSQGGLVILRGGRYELAATLALTAADSGITWMAYPGEVPILDGGTAITGAWTGPDGNGVYSKSYSGTTRNLWVGGIRATRARSAAQTAGTWTKTAGGWTAPSSAIAGYAHPEDVEIVGTSSLGTWKMFRGYVASATGTAITMRSTDWTQAADAPAGYTWDTVWWHEGVYELVAASASGSGYWAHDRHAGVLYYKPRAGEVMGTVSVIAGNLERILSITGDLDNPVTDVSLVGLTFAHSTWLEPETQGYAPIQTGIIGSGYVAGSYHKGYSATKLYACHGCTIRGCAFTGLGSAGLSMDYGTQDTSVIGCTFSDISAAAMSIGDVSTLTDYTPSDARSTVSRNLVRSCVISQPTREYWSSAAIFAGYVDNLTIDHVEIDDTRYSGICIGWGWGLRNASPLTVSSANSVTNCKITRWGERDAATLFQLSDGGGVYFNGPMAGSVVSGNYVSHSGTLNVGVSWFGLYLDNACEGVTVTANAVNKSTWAALQHSLVPYAINNTLTGNYAQGANALGAYDASNTVGSNTSGTFNSTALTIVANAGRI